MDLEFVPIRVEEVHGVAFTRIGLPEFGLGDEPQPQGMEVLPRDVECDVRIVGGGCWARGPA